MLESSQQIIFSRGSYDEGRKDRDYNKPDSLVYNLSNRQLLYLRCKMFIVIMGGMLVAGIAAALFLE